MKITFLGTGTSQGVPVIACECKVCKSVNPKDKRLRSSILIEYNKKNLVIDTGPDFRAQMLNSNVQNVDAILYTHEHKDHVAGLDDVRPICFKYEKEMDIYASQRVLNALKKEFHYIFDDKFNYPGIPRVKANLIKNNAFELFGKKIVPVEVYHYKLPVFAYRIDNFAYVTDANYIPEKEFEKLKGVKTLVINALRREKHISHFTLNEALEIIDKINPEKAYLTHISHLLGLHEEVSKELPNNVKIAHDQLTISI